MPSRSLRHLSHRFLSTPVLSAMRASEVQPDATAFRTAMCLFPLRNSDSTIPSVSSARSPWGASRCLATYPLYVASPLSRWYMGTPPTVRYSIILSSSDMDGWNSAHSAHERGSTSIFTGKRPYSGLSYPSVSALMTEIDDPHTTSMESVSLSSLSAKCCRDDETEGPQDSM